MRDLVVIVIIMAMCLAAGLWLGAQTSRAIFRSGPSLLSTLDEDDRL